MWGSLSFSFLSYDNAYINWATTDNRFQDGSLSIQRLTDLSQTVSNNNSIDACQSGTYYNQEQSGHGIMLEVLGDPADSVVITWFTYDENNQQQWLLANGSINESNANLDAFYTINSSFPPNFNTDEIENIQWGNINISKIDNDNINLSWTPNDTHTEFSSGTLDMTRLTHIQGLESNCNN